MSFHRLHKWDKLLVRFNINEENIWWPTTILEVWNDQSILHNEADLFQAKVLYSSMHQYSYQAVIAPLYFKSNDLFIHVDRQGRKLNESSWKIQDDIMDEDSSPPADDDHDDDSSNSSNDSWHDKVPLTSTKSKIKSKVVLCPLLFVRTWWTWQT